MKTDTVHTEHGNCRMAELFYSECSEEYNREDREFSGANHTLTHALTWTEVSLALIYERQHLT
jgi:hypothetical protein